LVVGVFRSRREAWRTKTVADLSDLGGKVGKVLLKILLVKKELLKGGVEVIMIRRWSSHVQSNESTNERSKT
jgi:hypothetical protein